MTEDEEFNALYEALKEHIEWESSQMREDDHPGQWEDAA